MRNSGKYGSTILVGKDVDKLLEGDVSSWRYAALIIPGLEFEEGSPATDFRKLFMSAFNDSFNVSGPWIASETLKLKLNTDQLINPELPMTTYVSYYTDITPGSGFPFISHTPCVYLTGDKLDRCRLHTQVYSYALAQVYFRPPKKGPCEDTKVTWL